MPDIINAKTPNAVPIGDVRIHSGNLIIDYIVAIAEQVSQDLVAAVIAEPVRCAGGVYPPSADHLPRLHGVCDRYEVLLVAHRGDHRIGLHRHMVRLERFDARPSLPATC